MLLAKSLLGVASVTESKNVPLSIQLLKGGLLKPISGGTCQLTESPQRRECAASVAKMQWRGDW